MRTVPSLASLLVGLLLAAGCSSPGSGDGDDDPGGPDGGTVDDDGDVTPPPDAGIDAPQAQSLTVCAAGDADFATIAAAVASANPGSTIRVCAGTYHEHLR